MTDTPRRSAPYQEWVLMYRKGLSRGQIADLTGAAPATVGYHLGLARTLDPRLQHEHDAAARKPAITGQGRERLQQLVAFVQDTGRYPSRSSGDVSERTLAAWLQRRRCEAADGTLAPAYLQGLAELPDWRGTPRAVANEARWQDRLTALSAYLASGHDWPRHKATVPGHEHELGVWLHTQRYKARRGELAPAKLVALDARVPGWRSGRTRGRKLLARPGPIQPTQY
ncbi:helicase associated domain-containing protein [Arthrobacter sp. NPDC093139]|uniref:helicase associated domain-containing protein n=1 Tax=Arthrobacter sp. NPDC093139 TaxID=3363945 RepID=UPI00380C92B9